MTSPQPSWRIKTRPCPFYQQGRCLFGDSCNYVHDAPLESKVKHVQHPLDTNQNGLATPRKPPKVIVDSPQSVSSPNRSPRTTGLLLALRDVIGDPDDEYSFELSGEASTSQTQVNSWDDSLPTLVNQPDFGVYSQSDADDDEEMEEETEEPEAEGQDNDEEDDSTGNWTAISDYSDDEDNSTTRFIRPDTVEAAAEPDDSSNTSENILAQLSNLASDAEPSISTSRQSRTSVATEFASGLLSPIELSTLNLGPFRQSIAGPSNSQSNSFDSGYGENWKPPPGLLATPPRSPSISSTFELLSSPFGSVSARILSPRLGVFMPTSPHTPSQSTSPAPTEDIEPLDLGLDSPQTYRESRESPTPMDVEDITSSWTNRTRDDDDDEETPSETDSDEEFFPSESYGHTSIWDNEGGSTAVYIGGDDAVQEQVTEAIQRLSRTPTHFLNSREIAFAEEEPLGHSSSLMEGEDSQDSIKVENSGDLRPPTSLDVHDDLPETDDTATAVLAYLQSPPPSARENDTLTTLYDIYSVIASPRDVLSDSMRNAGLSPPKPEETPLSNVSTPASSLKERVFTPPPGRGRSGTITADSPGSSSSPMTSLDSVSLGRASPFSPQEENRSGHESPGQEVEVSGKIPFGFRNTLSLGRTSRSSLLTTRNAGRIVPPSPLEQGADASASEVQSPESSASPPSSAQPKGLKPLRLSTVLSSNSLSRSLFQSRISASFPNTSRQSRNLNRTSLSSVSSSNSFSNSRLLSSARSSLLPLRIHDHFSTSEHGSSPSSPDFYTNNIEPLSAPPTSWRNSVLHARPSSRLSEPTYERDEDEDETTGSFRRDPFDETIRRPLPPAPHTAPVSRVSSIQQFHAPAYAIETPRPTLMFAIASDDVEQVKQVLENGDVNPNEAVGPQSVLEFTLTNDKLTNKLEIVKALLGYGADPASVKTTEVSGSESTEGDRSINQEDATTANINMLLDEIDPATRYYIERADAIHTKRSSALIQRSFFRPLTRVRYEVVGQDRAIEQLFRVLSMRARELSIAPIVVLLCGPSGHGKSLLARKFGALLDVPTHTVNMTTLRSSSDLWRSYSMSPYETPTTCTLTEFLINNEGKRCVVVLDEIEKTVDEKILWSLHMPWELGRCAFEANGRHVDVRNVIWLGTSNIGHDLVFQHQASRKKPDEMMSREEYVELMSLLRPKVSARLGASVLSRVSTVLPFVPFSLEEQKAICSETLHVLGGSACRTLSRASVQAVIDSALAEYEPTEGARSLHRAVSNQLLDIL